MKELVNQLVEISQFYGTQKEYTIASGGNTSVKDDHTMYVKASGFELGKIDENGYVALDREVLESIGTATYPSDPDEREARVKSDLLRSRVHPEKNLRPSVEASVHHAIRYRFVVHLHPTLVNAVTCSNNAEHKINELFGNEQVYIPYITPGYILYKEIERQNQLYFDKHDKFPQIFFLQNHGVFVGADTTEEIKEKYRWMMNVITEGLTIKDTRPTKELNKHAIRIIPGIRAALSHGSMKLLAFRNNSLITSFIDDDEKLESISKPFTPDGIVFCGATPLVVDAGQDAREVLEQFQSNLLQYRAKNGYDPKIIILRGVGVLAPGDNIDAANIALDVFEDILKIVEHSYDFGGPHHMEPEDVQFIEQWEVEAYRKGLIDNKSGDQPIKNRVVLVTGGAQGFGKEIISGLLENGAHVQMIDINQDLGRKVKAGFEDTGYLNKIEFAAANVTKSEELEDAVNEAILAFGGIDMVISNAGVLKAGPIHELDEKDFDLVTEVNYKGFYQMTRSVIETMKIQHQCNPDLFFDIIQINSKSGLQGSNKNFAYAGGKFGGIGLTQSFALELVDWNIKVNAICPGNYFEGPLWSDPERGLFAQYLKAGKVPGADTVDDVKKFYESKVPMKRGCSPADVLKTILYIASQKYETGQAIPVTGGQVMLN